MYNLTKSFVTAKNLLLFILQALHSHSKIPKNIPLKILKRVEIPFRVAELLKFYRNLIKQETKKSY